MSRQPRRLFVRPLLVGLLTVLPVGLVRAQTGPVSNVGTAAAQFLKIGPGARATAMGSAYAGSGGDISSAYYNPAGLSRVTGGGEATFSHANWLVGTTFDYAAASFNTGFGAVAFSVTAFQVPEDIVRTSDRPYGNGERFDAGSFALGMSYARLLTDDFAIGGGIRFVREQIWHESAKAIGFDFGTLYRTPFHGLSLGAGISNFGTRLQLEGRDLIFDTDPTPDTNNSTDVVGSQNATGRYDLPLTFRVGVAMDVYRSESFSLAGALDVSHPNDAPEFLNGGAEAGFRDIVFARAGLRHHFLDNAEGGFAYGGGIAYTLVGIKLKADLSVSDYGRLSNVPMFSLSVGY